MPLRAGSPLRFETEAANVTELRSLTPPFRRFKDTKIGMCDSTSPAAFIQDLGHFLAPTATACAQACIAFNANASNGYECNTAEFHAKFDYDAATFSTATDTGETYESWNCWIKVVHNICGAAPPQYSQALLGADLLVMAPIPSNCACPFCRNKRVLLHCAPGTSGLLLRLADQQVWSWLSV
jgi:hypothetical protein